MMRCRECLMILGYRLIEHLSLTSQSLTHACAGHFLIVALPYDIYITGLGVFDFILR